MSSSDVSVRLQADWRNMGENMQKYGSALSPDGGRRMLGGHSDLVLWLQFFLYPRKGSELPSVALHCIKTPLARMSLPYIGFAKSPLLLLSSKIACYAVL